MQFIFIELYGSELLFVGKKLDAVIGQAWCQHILQKEDSLNCINIPPSPTSEDNGSKLSMLQQILQF